MPELCWAAISAGYPVLAHAYYSCLPPSAVAVKYQLVTTLPHAACAALVASVLAGLITACCQLSVLERNALCLVTLTLNYRLAVQAGELAGTAAFSFAELNCAGLGAGYASGLLLRWWLGRLSKWSQDPPCKEASKVVPNEVEPRRASKHLAVTLMVASLMWIGRRSIDSGDGTVMAVIDAVGGVSKDAPPSRVPLNGTGMPDAPQLSLRRLSGTCPGASGSISLYLTSGQTELIVAIPPNTDKALITLDSNADLDMYLRLADGTCLAGFARCAISRGNGAYAGTTFAFSGDDVSAPVREWIQLTSRTTVWTYVYAKGYRSGYATVSYTYGVISPIPNSYTCPFTIASPPPPSLPPSTPPWSPSKPPSSPVPSSPPCLPSSSPPSASPSPPSPLRPLDDESVQRVTKALATALSASVVAAATASIVASAMSAMSTGAGGTGGASASVGGGIAPLVFGAQRFGCSSDLAMPKSEEQVQMANQMGWISGEISYLHETSAAPARRHLAESPAQLDRLFNVWISAAIAIAATFFIQGFLVFLWRHKLNRRWYRKQQLVSPDAADTSSTAREPTAKFIPFPKSLVWPSPLLFACSLFVTGLTRAATGLLASAPPGCGAACVAAASLTLAAVCGFVLLAFYQVILYRRLAAQQVRWSQSSKVPNPADPLMRLRVHMQVRLIAARGKVGAPRQKSFRDLRAATAKSLSDVGHKDRKLGGFTGLPLDDNLEPARTERLIARPFRIWHHRLGDTAQACEGFLMFRINGSSKAGVYYRLLVIVVNFLFGVVTGLKPLITQGSLAAYSQACTVLVLQLAMLMVCFCLVPDADRVVSAFMTGQYLFEALSTMCLLAFGLGESDAATGDHATLFAAFAFAMLAVLVPLLQLIEQRCCTPLFLLIENKGGSPLALAAAVWILIVSALRRICKLIGAFRAGPEQGDAAADKTADAGDDVDANEDATSKEDEGTSKVYSAEQAAETAANASKLLARGIAAKEVAAAKLQRPSQLSVPKKTCMLGQDSSATGVRKEASAALPPIRRTPVRIAPDHGDDDDKE